MTIATVRIVWWVGRILKLIRSRKLRKRHFRLCSVYAPSSVLSMFCLHSGYVLSDLFRLFPVYGFISVFVLFRLLFCLCVVHILFMFVYVLSTFRLCSVRLVPAMFRLFFCLCSVNIPFMFCQLRSVYVPFWISFLFCLSFISVPCLFCLHLS